MSSVMPRRRFAVRCGTLVNPNLFGHHLGTCGSVPAPVGTHRSVPNQQEVSPQLAGGTGRTAATGEQLGSMACCSRTQARRPAMTRPSPAAAAVTAAAICALWWSVLGGRVTARACAVARPLSSDLAAGQPSRAAVLLACRRLPCDRWRLPRSPEASRASCGAARARAVLTLCNPKSTPLTGVHRSQPCKPTA